MESSRKIGAPVDRGWAWMVVLGMFVSVLLMTGLTKSFGLFLDELVAYFDIPVAAVAAVMGVGNAVYTVTAPLSVTAGQHFGQRAVVVLGGLVGGLGLCLSGLLLNIHWLIFTFGALFCFGNASVYGNGLVTLNQYFKKKRSVANGLALSGDGVGLFLIPPLLQLLMDTYGLTGTFVIAGGLYLNIMACGLLYRPLSFYSEHRTAICATDDLMKEDKSMEYKESSCHFKDIADDRLIQTHSLDTGIEGEECKETALLQRDTVIVENKQNVERKKSLLGKRSYPGSCKSETCVHRMKKSIKTIVDVSVLRSYVVFVFLLSAFLVFCGNFNFALFMPSAAFSQGADMYQKAWLVSINGVCDIVGRILVGFIGDLTAIKKYKLMAFCALSFGLSIVCFSFASEFWVMAIFVALYGFFTAGYFTLFVPAITDLFGSLMMPKILAVLLFCQGLGVAVGQPLLGVVRDATGSYWLVHIINTVAIVVGSAGFLLLPLLQKVEKRRRQAEAVATDATRTAAIDVGLLLLQKAEKCRRQAEEVATDATRTTAIDVG